jgi:hypothetical protein
MGYPLESLGGVLGNRGSTSEPSGCSLGIADGGGGGGCTVAGYFKLLKHTKAYKSANYSLAETLYRFAMPLQQETATVPL